jgi:MoaA/NifB/PqqE/SkfB family radical SAM enzyme
MMRNSLYWDDFDRRTKEVVKSIQTNTQPKIRRVAVFITERCNFKCKYCNSANLKNGNTLTESQFQKVLDKYGDDAIIHITGGEPSVVKWLYPFIKANGDKYRFHLNTNAFIPPPAKYVKRLKISLDHFNPIIWNDIVGVKNAYENVVANIKEASKHTVVSLTYTLTKANYKNAVEFAKFSNKEFPNLYAVFFSVYKGDHPDFFFSKKDADNFFEKIYPELKKHLPRESNSLIRETLDEKRRLIQGVRFPQNDCNDCNVCYLSMSERVISPIGEEYTCSHLYRDGIYKKEPTMHDKCKYGCNRRLVMFNEQVKSLLT